MQLLIICILEYLVHVLSYAGTDGYDFCSFLIEWATSGVGSRVGDFCSSHEELLVTLT